MSNDHYKQDILNKIKYSTVEKCANGQRDYNLYMRAWKHHILFNNQINVERIRLNAAYFEIKGKRLMFVDERPFCLPRKYEFSAGSDYPSDMFLNSRQSDIEMKENMYANINEVYDDEYRFIMSNKANRKYVNKIFKNEFPRYSENSLGYNPHDLCKNNYEKIPQEDALLKMEYQQHQPYENTQVDFAKTYDTWSNLYQSMSHMIYNNDEEKIKAANLPRNFSFFVNDENDPVCAHCDSVETSLWRKIEGNTVCNACGLYFKMHGVKRPKSLKKSIIKKRRRFTKRKNTNQ